VALPDSELVILNDLKHSVLVEAPELIAAHARDFLRKRNFIHQTFAATSLTRLDSPAPRSILSI
jgi:hypothetical protein